MSDQRLSVVVTRRLPEPVERRLSELFDVTLNTDDKRMSRDALTAAVKSADVLVPTLTDPIDAPLLAQAGDRLKLIANFGAGVDHIDVATARQRGIHVSNTPGVVTEDTADMTMALILSVTRRIPEGLSEMQRGAWDGWAPTAHFLGGRLGGRRLGILGMGRIGQAVARRAARPSVCRSNITTAKRLRPETEEELGATYQESLDRMVSRCDIISVNCPHTPSTFHLMNARRLKLMKPDAVIVNTSRGEVIDENALTRMLRAGEIAGAGLDVFEHGSEINPRLRDSCPTSSCCRTWGRPPSKGGWKWASASSSTSRPSTTDTARPIWWCRRCCDAASALAFCLSGAGRLRASHDGDGGTIRQGCLRSHARYHQGGGRAGGWPQAADEDPRDESNAPCRHRKVLPPLPAENPASMPPPRRLPSRTRSTSTPAFIPATWYWTGRTPCACRRR